MKVDIQVERTAEALDQRDRTGVAYLAATCRLLDQERGNATVNDAEHFADDRRTARSLFKKSFSVNGIFFSTSLCAMSPPLIASSPR